MREYRTIDKSAWGDGAWRDEPDKVQWTDEATSLPCLAVRSPGGGHWCGYVGVDERHPLFKVSYDDAYGKVAQPHGGLTFSDACQHGPEDRGVCHVPEPGQPDNVWWFGFDCAHSGDLSPGYKSRGFSIPEDRYRTLDYVRGECAKLAKALSEVAV